jgi:hypothetical protein
MVGRSSIWMVGERDNMFAKTSADIGRKSKSKSPRGSVVY